MAPLGRNIYGEVGYVDTHFPHNVYPMPNPDGEWFDRDGLMVELRSKNGDTFPLNRKNWAVMQRKLVQKEVQELDDYLKSKGFFSREEVPEMVRGSRNTKIPMLIPVFTEGIESNAWVLPPYYVY